MGVGPGELPRCDPTSPSLHIKEMCVVITCVPHPHDDPPQYVRGPQTSEQPSIYCVHGRRDGELLLRLVGVLVRPGVVAVRVQVLPGDTWMPRARFTRFDMDVARMVGPARYLSSSEVRVVPTRDLKEGMRVWLPGGAIRTVSGVEPSGYVNSADESLLTVHYREPADDAWTSTANSSSPGGLWNVLDDAHGSTSKEGR